MLQLEHVFYLFLQEVFGEIGVNVCVHYLKTNPKLLNSGLGHHRLLLAAVDCVW